MYENKEFDIGLASVCCVNALTQSQLCNTYECFKRKGTVTHIDLCWAGDSIDFPVRDPETEAYSGGERGQINSPAASQATLLLLQNTF